MPDRSDLGDLIVERGPFAVGDVMQSPNGHPFITAAEINQLRDELIELIELRTVLAKVEDDQCGCLGGPLTMEWAQADDEMRATIEGDA